MGRKSQDDTFNYGSEFDTYRPPPPKVYKLSSSIPENLTASFQNLLNKRINDNYKVRKIQNLSECFTILKFTIIFIIFITTCKIITLFFEIEDRVKKQYNDSSSQETIRICFYSLFSFALLVQFIETYSVIFDKLCLTFVFTAFEFVIIIWAILDNYHAKDEHWLIILWLIGIILLVAHLTILNRMKMKRKKKTNLSRQQSEHDSIKEKEMNSESDQLYVPPQEQDCSYSDFLTQKQYQQSQASSYAINNQSGYGQSTIDMPNISMISHTLSKDDDHLNVDTNLVKFVNDEEDEHDKREKLCKELLLQCQMKIYHLEMSQCTNQMILDQQKELEKSAKLANGGEADAAEESNQTSELNSPNLSSSSCSDEMTCKEAVSKVILNGMNNLEYNKQYHHPNNNCQE